MKYVIEKYADLKDFDAWDGGEDTLNDLTKYCNPSELALIENALVSYLGEDGEEAPTDTQINDFLWFERDAIAEIIGFKSYDEFIKERGY